MGALFFAIFGIIFILFQAIDDKAAVKQCNDEVQAETDRINAFYNKVTNATVEHEIEMAYYSDKKGWQERISKQYPANLPVPLYRDDAWYLRIMLANSGYVRRMDVRGIRSKAYGDDPVQQQRCFYEHYLYMDYLYNLLRQHGVGAEMLFTARVGEFHSMRRVPELMRSGKIRGRYLWEPTLRANEIQTILR